MTAGVRVLTGADGGRHRFDPGSFCLELLLTGGPAGAYERYEILHTPADLAAWLPGSRLAAFAPLAESDVRIRPAELRAIRRFRDHLWTAVRAVAHGERPAPADLDVINESAGPPPRPRIAPGTGRREWVTPVTGSQILGAAAREAVDLVGSDLAARVRECAAGDCRLLFLDTSRPGTRCWCSMERCGNRHKVRDYRARRQHTGPSGS